MPQLMPFYLLNEISIAFISIENLAGLTLACFITVIAIAYIIKRPAMPGVRCPRCAAGGIEQWVLPGKHCPRCNQPC